VARREGVSYRVNPVLAAAAAAAATADGSEAQARRRRSQPSVGGNGGEAEHSSFAFSPNGARQSFPPMKRSINSADAHVLMRASAGVSAISVGGR